MKVTITFAMATLCHKEQQDLHPRLCFLWRSRSVWSIPLVFSPLKQTVKPCCQGAVTHHFGKWNEDVVLELPLQATSAGQISVLWHEFADWSSFDRKKYWYWSYWHQLLQLPPNQPGFKLHLQREKQLQSRHPCIRLNLIPWFCVGRYENDPF